MKGEYFIRDKAYDSIELMKEIDKRGMKPAIKVKETFRIEVKDELRREME